MLQSSMANELGRPVEVRAAGSYGELRDQLLATSVEIAWAPAAILAELPEARVVLRALRGGHSRYHSALIARAGRGIALDKLSGLRAAWVDPLSVGGHLLATAHLRALGIEPNLVFAQQDFLGSHRAVVDAVMDGTHDVTAVSTPDADTDAAQKSLSLYAGNAADRLAVIAVTASAPTDALVITSKVPAADAERIAKVLAKKGFLLSAMEAERLERASLDDYRALESLLWRKPKTIRPR
jgi:ABC-type phosphate/phosphonate transport system substrate-binding protein